MKHKVLIVDDNPKNLWTMKMVLKDLDIEVIEASSGEDALRILLHNDFALAILDVQMPNMDGYELAQFIRDDERHKLLPIIFVSAIMKDDFHIFKGYESGSVDYLSKPFNPHVLTSKVKVFVQLAQNQFELKKAIEKEKNASLAKSDFFNNLEYVIKNPLIELSQISEMLKESKDKLDDDGLFGVMDSNINYLQSLFTDLLLISKIESNNLTLTTNISYIQNVFEDYELYFKEMFDISNNSIIIEKTPDIPSFEADITYLDKIIKLLIKQINNFMTNGTIEISVNELERTSQKISFDIVIMDNNTDNLKDDTIFSFEKTQKDNTNSNCSGLELNLAKKLIEMMNGSLSLKNDIEKGNIFTLNFTFPICKENN